MRAGKSRRCNAGSERLTGNPDPGLQTVDRALTLLSYVSDHPRAHQLRELSTALSMNKAVVYRLLRTMESHGYITQDAMTNAYRIGPRALTLARYADPASVFERAREPMRALARESSFSTFLTLPLATDCICVDRAEAQTALRVSYSIGRRLPYHAGAPGKALLATFDAARRLHALGRGPLERFTDATIVDGDALAIELARIRSRGFATSAGEVESSISGVAATIEDDAGHALAVLSISGPSSLLHESLFESLGRRLIDATRAIAAHPPELAVLER
jgi:DNA-binding IclR family transcriptional regulator